LKRLVVHLGAHRAGSSTIQGILVRRQAALADVGVVAWTRRDLAGHPARRQILALPRSIARGLVAAVPIARAPGRLVIVSEENLLGRMPGHRGAGFYDGYARALRALGALGRVFDLGLRWIVRRQDRFLESVWSFRVGRGATEDFPSFAKRIGGSLHWLPIARALAGTRAEVRIALFEDLFARRTEGDIGRFLDLPPSPRRDGRRLAKGNAGLRGVAAQVMLRLNRIARLDPEARRRAVAALFHVNEPTPPDGFADTVGISRSLVTEAFAIEGDPPPRFRRRERVAFLETYGAENRELAAMTVVVGAAEAWRL